MDKEIIVFGVGSKIEEEILYIRSRGYEIKFFVDNDKSKWGTVFANCPVYSPTEIIDGYTGKTILISSEKFKVEIIAQLKDMGIYYDNCCIGLDDFEYRISQTQYDCANINKVKRNEDIFSVLYDSQVFSLQKQGGVSRYFYEIIKRMLKKDTSISLFKGVNNSIFDFENDKKYFLNYYSHYDDIGNINVKNDINAKMIKRFVACDGKFSIYHPTYYHEYGIGNYDRLVVTVYDMIHELYGIDRLTPLRKKRLINRADGIIAISQHTKDDLINIYGIKDDQIKVIYLANSLDYDVDEEAIVKSNYILFVGNRGGYKNGRLLMSAYAHSRIAKSYKLVFMGGGNFTFEEKRTIRELKIEKNTIQISGDDSVLANLYKYAVCFVYPSSYEGFGLPLLEAMHYGTAVITSNSASLPEVAGDAALYFENGSEEDLIFALEKMTENEEMRVDYARRGIEREKLFTWDKCADETYDYYLNLLKG